MHYSHKRVTIQAKDIQFARCIPGERAKDYDNVIYF